DRGSKLVQGPGQDIAYSSLSVTNKATARSVAPRLVSLEPSVPAPRRAHTAGTSSKVALSVEILDLPEAVLSNELHGARPVRHARALAGFLDRCGGQCLLECGDHLLDLLFLVTLPSGLQLARVESFLVRIGHVAHDHVVALSFDRADEALNRVARGVL